MAVTTNCPLLEQLDILGTREVSSQAALGSVYRQINILFLNSSFEYCIFNFNVLGVRSLANVSRARQFNPLNPPGVGWVPLPQTNMAAVRGRAWSVMRVRTWSCVRGRVCVVGHAWSCVVVCGRSCVRGRSCVAVRGRSCVVVHGRSCVVVPASRPPRPNERTTSNNPLNPPGVGCVNFVYLFKVIVSIRTCVPNLGSFRRPYRKCCLSNL